ncbi:MAG: hypothetical protein V1787_03625 [Candidatus Micrarchaeota archaeon]
MKALLFALAIALLSAGCLNALVQPTPSPTAVPTPEPTVEATPAVTPEPTPTPEVTVTERIVYITVTPAPTAVKVKGGLEILGSRFINTTFDIGGSANADYHANPFVAGSVSGGMFSELAAGEYDWKGVPLAIPEDRAETGAWSVLSTTAPDFYSKGFFPPKDYYSRIFIVLTARYGDREGSKLADLILHYADASSQTVELVAGRNVWQGGGAPDEAVLWRNSNRSEALSVLEVGTTLTQTKLANIEFRKTAAGDDGVIVFAASGQRELKTKRMSYTPTEFVRPQFDRDLTGVDTHGVHLTFFDREGRTLFYPRGTFTLPVYDAETLLATFTKVAWEETKPEGAQVRLEARVGPHEDIDRDWSGWFPVENGRPLAQNSRYLLLRATLSTSDEGVTPSVGRIYFEYDNPV